MGYEYILKHNNGFPADGCEEECIFLSDLDAPDRDNIDANCDGIDGVDADGDAHASRQSGGDDCDDTNAAISPLLSEVCNNTTDDDCNPATVSCDPAYGYFNANTLQGGHIVATTTMVAGYTNLEKLQIAKRYLAPRQIEEHGLSGKHIRFTDAGLMKIVEVNIANLAGVPSIVYGMLGLTIFVRWFARVHPRSGTPARS